MTGWRREMTYRDTGRPWIPPSPNLPRLEGVGLYPGMVLVEGTNLSEGRGTTTPFEGVGAPFVDPDALADALGQWDLPGIAYRPLAFAEDRLGALGIRAHRESPSELGSTFQCVIRRGACSRIFRRISADALSLRAC